MDTNPTIHRLRLHTTATPEAMKARLAVLGVLAAIFALSGCTTDAAQPSTDSIPNDSVPNEPATNEPETNEDASTSPAEGDSTSDGASFDPSDETEDAADPGATATTDGTDGLADVNEVHAEWCGSRVLERQAVNFAPGTTEGSVTDAVVRGDRHVHIANIREGQRVLLALTSLEDNAVFTVFTPNKSFIGADLTTHEFVAPESGDYQFCIGGTRGNASYELTVSIPE